MRHESQRILIVRPSALGDVCRSVTVAASLRSACPDARIDWLVQEEYADAIRCHPAVDTVISFPRRAFSNWWYSPGTFVKVVTWLNELRKRQYDCVYDFQGLGRSGFFTWATRAQRRIGFRQAREFGWLGYNTRYDQPRSVHAVDQMLSLLVCDNVRVVHDPTLYVPEQDQQWWRRTRQEFGALSTRYAVLAPTSRWASKRWPAENFASVLRPMIDRGIERFVVLGGPSEIEQVQPLLNAVHADRMIDLGGKTSIGNMMAVIEMADFLLANDSAPLHVAVGLRTPCLGLYGPTDPARVGPWQQPNAALRSPGIRTGDRVNYRRTDNALMLDIEPERVSARIEEILDQINTAEASKRSAARSSAAAVGTS